MKKIYNYYEFLKNFMPKEWRRKYPKEALDEDLKKSFKDLRVKIKKAIRDE